MTPKKKKETQIKKEIVIHTNIRCEKCFLVDGYNTKEKKCHFCDTNLFR